MTHRNELAGRSRLDELVAAYESAQADAQEVDLTDFLPPAHDPLYLRVLCELIRLDLEYRWEQGRARPLAEYLSQFPELEAEPVVLAAIAFEEYRLRCQAGAQVTPEEYRRDFRVDSHAWPATFDADQRLDPPHGAAAGHRFPGAAPFAAEPSSWSQSALRMDSLELMRALEASDPETARVLTHALAALPEAECTFLGFRLVAELGRGAFGRVYLAQQGDLADRPVALKISVDVSGESQTLAQLQHTNIVPIYSLHRAGLFQAVCMPYFGPTTLADVLQALRERGTPPTTGQELAAILRERSARISVQPHSQSSARDGATALPLQTFERLSYVEAVLWVGARLAAGLEHAHERGILHRDLKPANVLMTNEGQPMLVDFNLSADTKLDMATAHCGGTLPYMSPEHLAAFQAGPQAKHTLDARSDLYALGVILYELLTGRYPFATAGRASSDAVDTMLAERRACPAPVDATNRRVSPAAAAMVARLLEADPQRRYASAHDVRVDLERQLAHQPLQYVAEPSLRERATKWLRRHPRLTSPQGLASVALTVAAVALALAFWHKYEEERGANEALQVRQQQERVALQGQAQQALASLRATLASFRESEDELATVRSLFDLGPFDQEQPGVDVARCRAALDRYRVLDDPAWLEAPALQLLTDAERTQLRRAVSELLYLLARSILLDGAGAPDSAALALAARCNAEARGGYPNAEVPAAFLMQEARLAELRGAQPEADALYREADRRPPGSARDAYLAAYESAARSRYKEALALAEHGRDFEPRRSSTWFLLGFCHARLGAPDSAVHCYTTCLDLQPNNLAACYQRGLAHLELKHWQPAATDLTRVLAAHPRLALGYFHRAAARRGLGQYQQADADLTSALELLPGRAEFLFDRARLRELAGDATGAAQDDRSVLESEPRNGQGWTCRGISAARLRQASEAVACFRKALELDENSWVALQEMADVLSRQPGRVEEALVLVERALKVAPSVSLRLSRGHLLAMLGRGAAAQKEAEACVAQGSDAATAFQAACIYAQTARSNGERSRALDLVATALRRGFGRDELVRAEQLVPLHQDPRWREMLQAARLLDLGAP